MRLLANENVPAAAVEVLKAAGHDVFRVRREMPGSSDHDVLARAERDARVLVTFDKDFGELAFRHGLAVSSGIVLFRVVAPCAKVLARAVAAALSSRADWAGHFSVVEEDTIRMTPLPERRR